MSAQVIAQFGALQVAWNNVFPEHHGRAFVADARLYLCLGPCHANHSDAQRALRILCRQVSVSITSRVERMALHENDLRQAVGVLLDVLAEVHAEAGGDWWKP